MCWDGAWGPLRASLTWLSPLSYSSCHKICSEPPPPSQRRPPRRMPAALGLSRCWCWGRVDPIPHLSPPGHSWALFPPPLISRSALDTPSPDLCPGNPYAQEFSSPLLPPQTDPGFKALSFLGWSPPSRTPESQVQGRRWTQKSGGGAKGATALVPTPQNGGWGTLPVAHLPCPTAPPRPCTCALTASRKDAHPHGERVWDTERRGRGRGRQRPVGRAGPKPSHRWAALVSIAVSPPRREVGQVGGEGRRQARTWEKCSYCEPQTGPHLL